MKSAIIGLLFVGATANAQLSLTPQIGFDAAKTTLNYNDAASFNPLSSQIGFKAAVRMDYNFKRVGGPYVAFGSSPAVVEYSFTDPSKAMTDFKATAGGLQWKFEGGYQYTSKLISLKGPQNTVTRSTQKKSSCRTYSSCGQKKNAKAPSLAMRLQPSVGIAYNPFAQDALEQTASGYQYNAGSGKTALVTGMGFEFVKGKDRLFTVNLSYAKGLNENEVTTTSSSGVKNVMNTFSSSGSAWGLTLGVPFTLSKTKSAPKVMKMRQFKSQCSPQKTYKSKCVRKVVI